MENTDYQKAKLSISGRMGISYLGWGHVDVEPGTHLWGSPHDTHDADSHPSGEPRTGVLSVITVWGIRLETEPEETLNLGLDASSCPSCWVEAG